MRICFILEGCYPFVRGGVSTWVHQLMLANPQHEYVLWIIGDKAENSGKYKYELPKNVVEVHEVFLDDALRLRAEKVENFNFSGAQLNALRKMVLCQDPDWELLFRMYSEERIGVLSFLMSKTFLDILLEICHEEYPYIEFTDFFHTIRSMFLPILYLISTEVPDADVYHCTATGYGGLLAALGKWKYNRPLVVTEHGIYTREREEEILRAKWVGDAFRQHWINVFFMLSHCAYDFATNVTALFPRYSEIQGELGCEARKRKVIANGIDVKRFASVPPKEDDGWVDITAMVRIHPIKDIKTLIYAFYALKQRFPKARLHILGDTDDEVYGEECRGLIETLGAQDIIMPGNVNVVEYLAHTDFTVLSSISEGQPLAVLESFAAGRCVVATDVGCCRDLIYGQEGDDFGIAGSIVPTIHPQALATELEILCKRPALRKQYGENGKKRVNKYYVHADMVKNYNDNYEEAIAIWKKEQEV